MKPERQDFMVYGWGDYSLTAQSSIKCVVLGEWRIHRGFGIYEDRLTLSHRCGIAVKQGLSIVQAAHALKQAQRISPCPMTDAEILSNLSSHPLAKVWKTEIYFILIVGVD